MFLMWVLLNWRKLPVVLAWQFGGWSLIMLAINLLDCHVPVQCHLVWSVEQYSQNFCGVEIIMSPTWSKELFVSVPFDSLLSSNQMRSCFKCSWGRNTIRWPCSSCDGVSHSLHRKHMSGIAQSELPLLPPSVFEELLRWPFIFWELSHLSEFNKMLPPATIVGSMHVTEPLVALAW